MRRPVAQLLTLRHPACRCGTRHSRSRRSGCHSHFIQTAENYRRGYVTGSLWRGSFCLMGILSLRRKASPLRTASGST